MKSLFMTGRLVADRLISRVLVSCLVCMVFLLPTYCVYVGLRDGYNRQNALVQRTRERGYKLLERCDIGRGEVETLKENLKTALSFISHLECPDNDKLSALWEECKRDVECKRKDSRREAQELSSSVKAALEAYKKARNQVEVLKCLITEDARPKSEKVVSIDNDLRGRLSCAIAPLKSELSRPLPVNTVGVGKYLASCIGLAEIDGAKSVRELESKCRAVEAVLADVDMNRGDAESMSYRLNDACDKIRSNLKEMKAQEEVGQKAYDAFLSLPLDAVRTMAQFRQKHLSPLEKQLDDLNEQLNIVVGKWTSGVRRESLEEIHLASNTINSASAFVEDNRMELPRSTVESLYMPRSRLTDGIDALRKRIEDFDIDRRKATVLRHLEKVKNSRDYLEKEFEKIEKGGGATDEDSRKLIQKVGTIMSDRQDIAAEISILGQHIDDVRKSELKKLISAVQSFKNAVAKAVDTLPKVEYAAGFSAMCIPFKGNYGVSASDIEHLMKLSDGETVTGYRNAISFDKFNLENDAKSDFMAYRVFRFDFAMRRDEIGGLRNIVLKLSKNGRTLRRGSNRGFPGKLKVDCSLETKGIELSYGVLREKDGIDKNRSDSLRFIVSLENSEQTSRYATFSILVWISPYRETGWDYSGLSAEIYGVTTNGSRKELPLSHEVSR